jgi:3-deoxy-manno-octulosonate cytidylyltransferase (CMP-KDO synthetase)
MPTAVLIPARLAATRLPRKPLAPIAGLPMIVHVWRRAVEAGVGPVWVACAEAEIGDAVEAAGGEAVLTDPALPSGTDRIFQAIERVDPGRRFTRVVNLQGDMPTLDPAVLRLVLEPLGRLGCDIGTLANATEDPHERDDPNVVKAIVSFPAGETRLGKALYFTRAAAPTGPGPVLHHVGIYAFGRAQLARFCALPPSPLERRERLEQLRALEAGMSIGVRLVDAVPFGVDTPADLERARRILEGA